MKTRFQLTVQIEPQSARPYRIIETNETSEGPRTRVCATSFETLEFALKVLEGKRKAAA